MMEVMAPESGGTGMVQGVTENQFGITNEFPVDEQSRMVSGQRSVTNRCRESVVLESSREYTTLFARYIHVGESMEV